MSRKYTYDVSKIKTVADSINREYVKFSAATNQLDDVIRRFSAWSDLNASSFIARYKKEAEPEIKRMKEFITQYEKLMRFSANEISKAIDNGNSKFLN